MVESDCASLIIKNSNYKKLGCGRISLILRFAIWVCGEFDVYNDMVIVNEDGSDFFDELFKLKEIICDAVDCKKVTFIGAV